MLVLNAPTSSCCGQPRGQCKCSPQKDQPAGGSLGIPVWNWEPPQPDGTPEQKPAQHSITNDVHACMNGPFIGDISKVLSIADGPAGGALGLPSYDW